MSLVSPRMLEDALDHIMRIAAGSSGQTKRLRFIELRARAALNGEDWNPDREIIPKMASALIRVERARLIEAVKKADLILVALHELNRVAPSSFEEYDALMKPIRETIFTHKEEDDALDQRR